MPTEEGVWVIPYTVEYRYIHGQAVQVQCLEDQAVKINAEDFDPQKHHRVRDRSLSGDYAAPYPMGSTM